MGQDNTLNNREKKNGCHLKGSTNIFIHKTRRDDSNLSTVEPSRSILERPCKVQLFKLESPSWPEQQFPSLV